MAWAEWVAWEVWAAWACSRLPEAPLPEGGREAPFFDSGALPQSKAGLAGIKVDEWAEWAFAGASLRRFSAMNARTAAAG